MEEKADEKLLRYQSGQSAVGEEISTEKSGGRSASEGNIIAATLSRVLKNPFLDSSKNRLDQQPTI